MSLLTLLAATILVNPAMGHSAPRPDSVIHDSIYALAVNPADYPKEWTVFLLDEGVYRIEPDGRGSRTLRQVVQILKPNGALPYREQRFSYDPDRERLVINWIRIVKPSGEVISGHPEQVQESDVPAAMGVPMYTSTKVRRMSLSGLDSGTVLDYSYTTEELKPPMPGDFFYGWRVNPPVPVRRSLLVVDVPTGFVPRIEEKNLSFRRTERNSGGRTLYTWAIDKVSPPKTEIYAPDSSVKVMSVGVSPPFGWEAVGEWYASIAANRYAITPPVAEKIRKVVANARTLDDSVRAIHKWVSSDIRYVAIALGPGGYVPRDAATVTETGFGDCKDKTMLFLAALRSIGVTGYPVLVNALGKVDEAAPSVEAFNHMIAAVQTGNGYRYADLTVADFIYGQLPPWEDGKFGLLIRDRRAEEIHLPAHPASERRDDVHITGSLSTDGTFNGIFEERLSGGDAARYRMMVSKQPDSATKARMAQTMAADVFEGADGDSLTIAMAADSSEALVMTARIRNAKAASGVANLELLTNPIRSIATPGRVASVLEKEPARTLPIDLSKLTPPTGSHTEAAITLPEGWHALLPKSVSYSGFLGTFEFSFTQIGNELRISRTFSGVKGVVGPERIGDVIAALKQMTSGNTRTIAIQKQ